MAKVIEVENNESMAAKNEILLETLEKHGERAQDLENMINLAIQMILDPDDPIFALVKEMANTETGLTPHQEIYKVIKKAVLKNRGK